MKNIIKSIKKIGQKGYSLVEVVIAAGIGTIVSSGVAAVFIFALEQFTVLVEQNAAEESLLWASYQTRAFFGQAIDVNFTTAAISNNYLATADGEIRAAFDGRAGANSGVMTTIAVFGREGQIVGAGSGVSDLWSTGIFYWGATGQAVSGTQPPLGGVLFFDTGNSAAAGAQPLTPGLGKIWFDRLSQFQISDVECITATGVGTTAADCNGNNAKSMTVTIRARYFKIADRSRWYFNETLMPGGAVIAPYRDVEMAIKVGFRNNILLDAGGSRVGGTTAERLHGGLYFFRMLLPPLRM